LATLRRVSDVGTSRSVVVVYAWDGQPSAACYAAEAARGERPRKDYVEVASALGAEVIDHDYMTTRAAPLSKFVARRAGMEFGQITEARTVLRRASHVVAWGDRLGMGLALTNKYTRGRRDLIMIGLRVTTPVKLAMLTLGRPQTHLHAMVHYGSVQMTAAQRLGVPGALLTHLPQPVDERFWHPAVAPSPGLISAVGGGWRDFPTLARAVSGLAVTAELAVGSMSNVPSRTQLPGESPAYEHDGETFPNVRVHRHLPPLELRELYARSQFVVLPLHECDFDAGATAVTEAMAMGKAVVMSRTRGQRDFVEHGRTGYYVPPGDVRALRDVIARLLDRPEEAAAMGRAARTAIEQRFTMDRYVQGVVALARTG
jgi:hypothetical protein